jgi:hypothetical protein
MPPVCATHRGNIASVTGCSEPVVNRGADATALDWRLTWTMVPRNQQNYPIAALDRQLESPVDCLPGPVEIHAVEIEDAVGLDRAGTQSPVPASVERPLINWEALRRSGCR